MTDAALMTIPLDDHMVHRGHGVFDTATLRNGRVYRLDAHLQRLQKSAAAARIELPCPIDRMKEIVLQTCAASGQRDGSVRAAPWCMKNCSIRKHLSALAWLGF